jgi:hypothetical protein
MRWPRAIGLSSWHFRGPYQGNSTKQAGPAANEDVRATRWVA